MTEGVKGFLPELWTPVLKHYYEESKLCSLMPPPPPLPWRKRWKLKYNRLVERFKIVFNLATFRIDPSDLHEDCY